MVPARSAGGLEVVEVCTSQGVRWVGAEAAQGDVDASLELPDETGGHDGVPHCPLCRFMGDTVPDLTRGDLRFAPPREHAAPAFDKPAPVNSAARVVLNSPPRAPPLALL